jgi:5'-3' exoribonuclease 2
MFSAEERQDQESKRRKLEREQKQSQVKTVSTGTGPSPALALTTSTNTLSGPLAHPSLPPRPSFDFAAKADSIGFGAKPTPQSIQNAPAAAQALGGSNRDVVANRAAIRMANMSAAEMLKAELAGAKPVKPDLSLPPKPTFTAEVAIASPAATDDEFPGFGGHDISSDVKTSEDGMEEDADAEGEPDPDNLPAANGEEVDSFLPGIKRKIDEVENEADNGLGSDEDDAPGDVVNVSKALKVNPDGTVDQEDTIKYVITYVRLQNLLTDLTL